MSEEQRRPAYKFYTVETRKRVIPVKGKYASYDSTLVYEVLTDFGSQYILLTLDIFEQFMDEMARLRTMEIESDRAS